MIFSRKNSKITGCIAIAILCLLFVLSCDNSDNGNGGGVPSELVSGTVRDVSGAPLEGVAIHVIYEIEEMAAIGSIGLSVDAETLLVELIAEPILQIGDRQLTLSFHVTNELNVLHYDIMRDGGKVAELEVADGSYTYVDQNLTNGRRYEYSIVAVGLNETLELEMDGNSVWAASPSFLAPVVTEYAFHQNFPNPVEDTTHIIFDILEPIYTQLTIRPVGGGTIATLASAFLMTGRYASTLDMSNLANGFYECQMDTGDSFFASCTLLKNTQDYASLRSALPNSTTLDNGSYALDVAIGDSIGIRDDLYNELGRVLLERVTFVAFKNGYLPADTTIDLTEQEHYTIDFTLLPE